MGQRRSLQDRNVFKMHRMNNFSVVQHRLQHLCYVQIVSFMTRGPILLNSGVKIVQDSHDIQHPSFSAINIITCKMWKDACLYVKCGTACLYAKKQEIFLSCHDNDILSIHVILTLDQPAFALTSKFKWQHKC